MDDRERITAFYSRFGLSVDVAAETNRFRTRLHSVWIDFIRTPAGQIVRDRIESEFAMFNGSTFRQPSGYVYGDRGETVSTWLEESVPHDELMRRFHALLSAISAVPERATLGLVADFSRAINLSPGINLRIEKIGETYELLPAGASLMDDGAVIPALEWLHAYPGVRAEFGTALKILAHRDVDAYRQAQDSLRKALEDLLKQLLDNNEPVEEQKRPLKEWLATKRVHEELRNTIVGVMDRVFKHYQNASIKHSNDGGGGSQQGWATFEVEYLVYQFATLVRVLIEASQRPNAPKE
ncbi:MAG TPA: hypothetical protein VNN08_24770 [Thermoanaerobaculia bacterium]|nr:hypothetical protein [Thermoanaerobaculia bacterium]